MFSVTNTTPLRSCINYIGPMSVLVHGVHYFFLAFGYWTKLESSLTLHTTSRHRPNDLSKTKTLIPRVDTASYNYDVAALFVTSE